MDLHRSEHLCWQTSKISEAAPNAQIHHMQYYIYNWRIIRKPKAWSPNQVPSLPPVPLQKPFPISPSVSFCSIWFTVRSYLLSISRLCCLTSCGVFGISWPWSSRYGDCFPSERVGWALLEGMGVVRVPLPRRWERLPSVSCGCVDFEVLGGAGPVSHLISQFDIR